MPVTYHIIDYQVKLVGERLPVLKRQELSTDRKPGLFYGWYMVGISWIMVFLVHGLSVAIFFKPMLEEFGYDRATFSSVQSVALLAFAVSAPFMGRLVDRFGPRVMMLVTAGTQTLNGLISGAATSIWHLYLARYLYYINAVNVSHVLTNRWFIRKRGTALGIVATGSTIGTLFLSPVSQYLILLWGWRMTMFFWAGVMFVIMLPLALMVRDNPEDKGYLPDGESLNSTVQTALSTGQQTGVETGISLSAAARTGAFWLISATSIICGFGCGFMMTHIVIFATDMGYSEMIGTSLVSVQGGVNLAGILLTGYMSDRIARRTVLALTYFIRGMSFVTMAIFIHLGGAPLWVIYVAMALFGFGWFTTSPLSAGLIADLFGRVRMGTIMAVNGSFHMFGMAIGAYAGGAIFEVTGSYYLFVIAQGLLELLAAALAFLIGNRGKGTGDRIRGKEEALTACL